MTKAKLSKKDARKIQHLEALLDQGVTKAKVIQKGLHFMKMKPEHVQQALGRNIYG